MAENIFDNIMNDLEDVKVQTGRLDRTEGTPIIRIFRETLRPKHITNIIKRNVTGTAFVLDINNTMDDPAILMDTGYTSWKEVHSVVNTGNVWKEFFRQNTFMDGDPTTATADYTNFRIDLTPGELYQTIAIFKDNKSIDSVLVSGGSTEEVNVTIVDRDFGGKRVDFS